MAAGKGPGQVAVRLDRLAKECQEIFREDPLADLTVEVFVLIEGDDQASTFAPEGVVAGGEQAGQADKVLRAGFGWAAAWPRTAEGLAEQGDQGFERDERLGLLHGDRDDPDFGRQEAIEVTQHRRLSHAAAAIEDNAGTAGAEHDLLLELTDDPIAGHERLLLTVHRISGAENLGRRLAPHDGLRLLELAVAHHKPMSRGGVELRGQRLVEPAHPMLKILDLGPEQSRQGLAEDRSIDGVEPGL